MPSEVRFAVVRRELERHGWTLDRIKGSHHTFLTPGEKPIVLPVHGNKVKPWYIREIAKDHGIAIR